MRKLSLHDRSKQIHQLANHVGRVHIGRVPCNAETAPADQHSVTAIHSIDFFEAETASGCIDSVAVGNVPDALHVVFSDLVRLLAELRCVRKPVGLVRSEFRSNKLCEGSEEVIDELIHFRDPVCL